MTRSFVFVFFFLTSQIVFGQVNPPPGLKKQEAGNILKADTSQNNYKVSYFIVGRIRTVEISDGIPFEVRISAMNPYLFGQQIKFRILDLDHYQISYTLGTAEMTEDRVFDEALQEPDFQGMILRKDVLNKDDVDNLKFIEYRFSVQKKTK
jgi:hypothetical protein